MSNTIQNGKQLNAKKILFPMTLSSLPQLFLINSGVWEERSEIEIVESRTLSDTMPELKKEEPDVEPSVHNMSRMYYYSFMPKIMFKCFLCIMLYETHGFYTSSDNLVICN